MTDRYDFLCEQIAGELAGPSHGLAVPVALARLRSPAGSFLYRKVKTLINGIRRLG